MKNKITLPTYDEITTVENLLSSFKKFGKNKKYKTDVTEFTAQLFTNITDLHTDLHNNTYTHSAYTHFTIADPKKRDIHKSSVRDRVVHHMLYHALYPYFDSKFIHDSYSCRINKGTHRGIDRFKKFSRKCSCNNTRTCWVLKCDIRKFFASIKHQILKSILCKHIHEERLATLLENIIDSFCSLPPLLGGGAEERGRGGLNTVPHPNPPLHRGGENTTGLPLGNLTSQLLVNIYMNKFDQFVKHRLKQKYYIRYADDFVFLADNKKELEKLLPSVRKFLWEQLRLELHPDKVFIKTIASGVDFLGWVHFTDHRVLRTATRRRMIRNLKDNQKIESVASYQGMLSHGNAWKLQKQHLDFNQDEFDIDK